MLEVLCAPDLNAGRLAMTWRGDPDVALQPVEDPDLVVQVTEAYRAKYADQPSLVAMFLGPPGTEATLRVDQS
jgi:hypothetical protein